MRISDWSSDVCSSDLTRDVVARLGGDEFAVLLEGIVDTNKPMLLAAERAGVAIGRASCRERVCQYVYISVVAVSFKKKQNNITQSYLVNVYILIQRHNEDSTLAIIKIQPITTI